MAGSILVSYRGGTHALVFAEIIAPTELIDCAVAVVVEVVVAPVIDAICRRRLASSGVVELSVFTNACGVVSIVALAAFIDRAVAVVVKLVVADLIGAVSVGFEANAFGVSCRVFAHSNGFVEVVALAAFVDASVTVVVYEVTALFAGVVG